MEKTPTKTITKKIPGGKLIRLDLTFGNNTDLIKSIKSIKSIKITGDFFLHPEETITDIEDSLKGKGIDEVQKTIEEVLRKNNAELIGVSAENIAGIIAEGITSDEMISEAPKEE